MYCPNCGQQQVSGDLRFCSKCGLPMGLVAEILNHGGILPQLAELGKKKKFFSRKNGIFFSIFWFILFVPFGAAFWGVLEVDELAALSAVFGVFSSILILLFSLFFLGSSSENTFNALSVGGQRGTQHNLGGIASRQGALPPQQTQTAHEYVSPQAGAWKAPDTGDLVTPGSVTEGTTRLLQKDED